MKAAKQEFLTSMLWNWACSLLQLNLNCFTMLLIFSNLCTSGCGLRTAWAITYRVEQERVVIDDYISILNRRDSVSWQHWLITVHICILEAILQARVKRSIHLIVGLEPVTSISGFSHHGVICIPDFHVQASAKITTSWETWHPEIRTLYNRLYSITDNPTSL